MALIFHSTNWKLVSYECDSNSEIPHYQFKYLTKSIIFLRVRLITIKEQILQIKYLLTKVMLYFSNKPYMYIY